MAVLKEDTLAELLVNKIFIEIGPDKRFPSLSGQVPKSAGFAYVYKLTEFLS